MGKTTERLGRIFDHRLECRPRWRGALLGPLIALGLAGCTPVPIYVPADEVEGREVDPKSVALIKTDVTTRQEVLAQLGKPDAICEDGRVLFYGWDHVNWYGTWLWFGPGKISTHHMVLVQVDDTDRVKRVEQIERPSRLGAVPYCGLFISRWANGKIKDEHDIPEKRALRQILLPDEAAAKRAEALLGEGQSFDKVAQDVTGKAPIDIGTVTDTEILSWELAKAAFELKEGGFSAPIATPLGWHTIQVTKIIPGGA